ncbi:acyl-ACP--UDP-N-acetylglucosamine O-acyltransferase [Mariprofundus erugo]|uniref:Acyl-[acyl-carrier-protein]--UDP-N-acetylglucosamine O-acyltransferase n=1 Tax=Mariprofundus erugo TaxID=2528639 RepID=A0A5R9GLD7_9PROT|nr:acyl-ACP--UDP-N-acetylglucosamine O-acyltransferase [Mariprofundus erugo]TLS67271.1 acyl-ACP--UDP-N-acetylglucosamine O-acyltransferase [Mariprofundus erugo]TLS76525.1 acyl-ACP--UDP-N-acetylglucosamine O-acyltransferase [Mariprofundus erugo]
MSQLIHPTAIVDSRAEIGSDVTIGPYCCIGPDVVIGDDCELQSHVVITGHTRLGSANRIFPFASIGQIPQDLKYKGENSQTIIGSGNQIRENVTINSGTSGGGMVTSIGDNNLLMAYTHVAHDCHLGSRIVLANCATLAGHVEVADQAIIGGLTAIQQFVRIGRLAMIGGMSGVTKDVPPFCLLAGGYRAGLSGLNMVGLKRHGFTLERVGRLKEVYRLLLQDVGRREERLLEAEALIPEDDEDALAMLEFIRTAKRGLSMHARDSE